MFIFIQNFSEIDFLANAIVLFSLFESSDFFFRVISESFPDRNCDLNTERRLQMSTSVYFVIHGFLFWFFLFSGYFFSCGICIFMVSWITELNRLKVLLKLFIVREGRSWKWLSELDSRSEVHFSLLRLFLFLIKKLFFTFLGQLSNFLTQQIVI